VVVVPQLTDHGHADGLLWFNELTVEQFDQHVSLTGLQQVAARCRNGPQRIPASIAEINPDGDRTIASRHTPSLAPR
jgi:hypothetical protein